MTRVFVSSFGAVTPSGIGSSALIADVFSGNSMITNTSNNFSIDGINSNVSGFCNINEQDDFFLEIFPNKKEYNRMDKFLKLSIIAFEEAARKINLNNIINEKQIKKEKIGSLIGCGIGGLDILSNAFLNIQIKDSSFGSSKKISPFTIPYGIINMASSLIAMRYDLRGPTIGVSSACSSANHSIALGYQMIKSGFLDMVVVGGTEAAVNRVGIGAFDAMKALSTKYNSESKKASRPFDKERDGFVISEGAGILILESEDSIKKRKAKAIAEIKSVAMSSLVSHITSPDEEGEGAAYIMEELIKDAKLNPEDIGIINMHATSTKIGDEIEAKAIKKAFGKNFHKPILSATKSITGHMLGAISAIEAILLIEMLNKEIVPANLNLEDIDDFAKDMNISKYSQKVNTNYGISNSFGFGGTNAGVLISKI